MTAAAPGPVKRSRKWVIVVRWTALIGLGIWLALSSALFIAMSQPPEVFGTIMARTPLPFMMILPFETLWKHAREGDLDVGETAPDFRLPTLDHKGAVQLSRYRSGRPVVLVFGSYT
jgi:hypothetical protein